MKITLSPEEKDELEALHKEERDSRVCDRMKSVLLNSEGWTVKRIAQALRIHKDTVTRYLLQYLKDRALKPKNKGSEGKLNDAQTAELKAHVANNLYRTALDIKAYVEATYKVSYTLAGMTDWLNRNKFSYKETKGQPAKAVNTNGETPLFIASQNGHTEIVKALLTRGAAINQARTDGATPLLIASYNGHTATVQALLAAGANVNQACTDGATPLSIAAIRGHVEHMEVVKALFTHIETIQFTKTTAFEAFQEDLIRVSTLDTLSYEMRGLCITKAQKSAQEKASWSLLRAAWTATVVRGVHARHYPAPTGAVALAGAGAERSAPAEPGSHPA